MRKTSAFISAILGLSFWVGAETISVSPERSVIVLHPGAEKEQAKITTAAEELAKHLQLITGTEIPTVSPDADLTGKYAFHVGAIPAYDQEPLAVEEARWGINADGAHFYGHNERVSYGTQIAVYAFLEEQLGVRWIEPGDAGIYYTPQSTLRLTTGDFNWVPKLVFRKIRQSIRLNQPHRPIGAPYTDAFLLPDEEHNARVQDEVLWEKRMRMGGSRPGGGHAFSTWWEKYGEKHPEYFALNKFGKREPIPLAKKYQTNAFIKICPSNPRVAEQLVEDWLPSKERVKYVSTGPNDGHNFCECENCRALDVTKPGEKFDAHLTDRYVHLSNQVARKIRQYRPDAYAALYGYLTTLYPPRKLEVEPNVVVHIVPYVDPLDSNVVESHFGGWKKAGATKLALRPNYHHKYLNTSMPLGLEKQMFDVFRIAYENGCISGDYDSAMGHWPLSGMSDYILAKAMSEPDKPFDYWEDHYCRAYGAAAEDVKQYFRYWRTEMWEKRLLPNIRKICELGKSGDFGRGLMWSLDEYYKMADFDRTDEILAKASASELSEKERAHLQQLVLANRHARQVLKTIAAKGQERFTETMQLAKLREELKDDLRMSWVRLIGWEARYANPDAKVVHQFKEYPLPWRETGMAWNFQMDPENVGRANQWQKLPFEETEKWERLRVDNFWEHAYDSETEESLRKRLKNYDGVAWYASRLMIPAEMKGREILLVFGGVGDSCTVHVNGQTAGSHTVANEQDKKQSFTIRIDPLIDWEKRFQEFMIRVENRKGLGGIYGRIWLVSKHADMTMGKKENSQK